ncbi:MAG: hypothetical protein PHF89_05640 [Eubacteriales bacterium]|nr:hypothetical protein [Eubacteriales bacterium]
MIVQKISFNGRRKIKPTQHRENDFMEKAAKDLLKQKNFIDIYKTWNRLTLSGNVLKLSDDRLIKDGYLIHLKTGNSASHAEKLKLLEEMNFDAAPKHIRTIPLKDQHYLFITQLSKTDKSRPVNISLDRRYIPEKAIKTFIQQIEDLLAKGFYNPEILANNKSLLFLPQDKKIIALGWDSMIKTNFINKENYIKQLLTKL